LIGSKHIGSLVVKTVKNQQTDESDPGGNEKKTVLKSAGAGGERQSMAYMRWEMEKTCAGGRLWGGSGVINMPQWEKRERTHEGWGGWSLGLRGGKDTCVRTL